MKRTLKTILLGVACLFPPVLLAVVAYSWLAGESRAVKLGAIVVVIVAVALGLSLDAFIS
jgi:hypothetical protein